MNIIFWFTIVALAFLTVGWTVLGFTITPAFFVLSALGLVLTWVFWRSR